MTTDLISTYQEELEAQGINASDFVSYMANEWTDGYFQGLCSEEDLEAGAHYVDAVGYINNGGYANFLSYVEDFKASSF